VVSINDTVYTDVAGTVPLNGLNLTYHITLPGAIPYSAGDISAVINNQGKIQAPLTLCGAPAPTLYQIGVTSWFPDSTTTAACAQGFNAEVYIVMATPTDRYPSAGDIVYIDNTLSPAAIFPGSVGFYRYRNATISGGGWIPFGNNLTMRIDASGVISDVTTCNVQHGIISVGSTTGIGTQCNLAMASAIRQVLEDEQCQRKLVNSGLSLVKQFAWSEVSQHWLSLYKKLAT
jgi:hypothetical protein